MEGLNPNGGRASFLQGASTCFVSFTSIPGTVFLCGAVQRLGLMCSAKSVEHHAVSDAERRTSIAGSSKLARI